MDNLHKPKVVVYNRKTCLVLHTAKSVFQLVTVEDAQVLLVAVGNGDGEIRQDLVHEADGDWAQVAQMYLRFCGASGCEEVAEVLSNVLASAGVNPKNNLETAVTAKKTAAKAVKKTAKTVKPVKTAATKAVAAEKTDKTPKITAPATPKEKKPRVSVSGRIRELILEGKLSDDKIFAKVQSEFNLDDKKRSYIAWNRSDLVRKGEKVPAQVGV